MTKVWNGEQIRVGQGLGRKGQKRRRCGYKRATCRVLVVLEPPCVFLGQLPHPGCGTALELLQGVTIEETESMALFLTTACDPTIRLKIKRLIKTIEGNWASESLKNFRARIQTLVSQIPNPEHLKTWLWSSRTRTPQALQSI